MKIMNVEKTLFSPFYLWACVSEQQDCRCMSILSSEWLSFFSYLKENTSKLEIDIKNTMDLQQKTRSWGLFLLTKSSIHLSI